MQNTTENQNNNQVMDAISAAMNDLDAALGSTARILYYDPSDVQTLFGLIRDELQKDPHDVDASLLIEFLTFHRAQIKPSLVGHFNKILSYAYAEASDVANKARINDMAANPEDDASVVIGMIMDKAYESGEDAVSEARSALLASMPSAEMRAQILAALGDYHIIRREDTAGAQELYLDAHKENPDNLSVCQRILANLEHKGAWSESIDILDTLIKLAANDDDKIKYMCKKAWLDSEKLGDSAHAIEIFNQILEIRPACYGAFKQINALLLAQKDFAGIDKNYTSMIERIKSDDADNTPLLAVLWKDLGNFRLNQLNDPAGAIEAFKELSRLYPDNIQFHLQLARLYEMNEDTLHDAVRENRECLALALETLPALSGLARCYRKLGMFDESLCTYRVLNALHFNDEDGDAIVSKFADMGLPDISEKLPDDLWTYLIPPTLDKSLVKLFKICSRIISDMFSNEFSTYGIHERDAHIDISENTTFNNTIRNETKALGFGEVPLLYRCEKFSGVTNAYFTKRSFLIHPTCLKGRSYKELAFMTAKAMMLMRPEYYLLELGIKSVELILMTIFKTVKPEMNDIILGRNQLQVSKTLDKGLSPEERATLSELIDEISKRKNPYLLLYMESVEDFANRVALLFCDDPTIVENLLGEESKPISSRTMHSRMKTLMRWALSEDYFTLRKKLNIALKA